MSNKTKYIKEACVEGIKQAQNAEKQGADRIELCARLDLDGLTPDMETISSVFQKCNIPIRVIIRPVGGGFIYSSAEFEEMKQSIIACKELGVEGVVFGITTKENTLDISKTKELVQLAHPLKVTIHKAIDSVEKPLEDLDRLLEIEGVDAVLTSGKGQTWKDGENLLLQMISRAGDKMEIIACGKVTNDNMETVHESLQSSAYHGKLIVGQL
ncbi:copper homeostasis protein CutC [Carboxylicivirga sp. N1Y90]|uniref:copper homeostasis protein CutC n=1 Tax=Carboxylicivirga fragile TaxID=3417571 RepID=UPI003D335913|nr:hypothetical protein [Marinilabiliaceae bacterium N1Y90]